MELDGVYFNHRFHNQHNSLQPHIKTMGVKKLVATKIMSLIATRMVKLKL